MATFTIRNPTGRCPINGRIRLQGAKNASLLNIALPLLTSEPCVITNTPLVDDVEYALCFLRQIGANVNWLSHDTVSIECASIYPQAMDPDLALRTTHSRVFIPLLVARFGEFVTGPPGGCDIGDRAFQKFTRSLEAMGIACEAVGERSLRFYSAATPPSDLTLPFPSFGLTVNAVLVAATHRGALIRNACREPEIDNMLDMLGAMGATVRRDEDVIAIIPPAHFKGVHFRNLSDRNVAVTYASMALIGGGNVILDNIDDVKFDAFYGFLDSIGAHYQRSDRILHIFPVSHEELRPVTVRAFLFPQFHSDWQPLVAPLLTQIRGQSRIEENLFPDRLRYWTQLEKLGATYHYIYDKHDRFDDTLPHAVEVTGPSPLHAAHVRAPDLRGGAALVIASLAASGTTVVDNAEVLRRGYCDFVKTLQDLGIDITEKENG
jgi:UDP-N-acetylglucosamine 1-carboxyvinyltransferase